MTLLLQPVFVELNPPSTSVAPVPSSTAALGSSSPPRNSRDALTSNCPSSEPDKRNGSAAPQTDTVSGMMIESTSQTSTALAEDRLHSMWKVATKVKSVMADGARFENLTWRAWYRKNQLEKIERERQQAMATEAVGGIREVFEATVAPFMVGSQATAIPGRSLSTKVPGYGSGYSTILAEIQEASARRAPTLMPGISPADSSTGSQSSRRHPGASAAADASSVEPPSEAFAVLAHSSTSISTTAINSSRSLRRRKKNVDKFIKRQQLQQQQPHPGQAPQPQPLERICEESGTPITPVTSDTHPTLTGAKVLDSTTKPPRPRGKNEETSSFTTNDTISGGSLGDTSEGQAALRPKSGGLTFALRRSDHISYKGSSPSSGERPNVSLLTMLLNRGSFQDSRRSESCPPPILSMSPPMRPGAPVPSEVALNNDDPSLNVLTPGRRSSSETPHEPMATPPSPPVTIAGGISGMGGSGNRRRPAPKTADFTTPLFIW